MAAMYEFRCDQCDHAIEAWDDGNPYYIDEQGTKHYAWHPSLMRDQCVGNDSPQLCLSCLAEFMLDSNDLTQSCPNCGAKEFVDLMQLNGKACPWCRAGVFQQTPGLVAIS